ncbi:MAG: mannitol-1-phosphate 5-dehydrogenase [Clostridia bacterium]
MKAIVFGAGKIARGFIGQLLYRSGYEIVFVESNVQYAKALDAAGRYYVNVMGNERESEWIEDHRTYNFQNIEEVADALYRADIAFTSVVGKNLPELGAMIARAFSMRPYVLDSRKRSIVTCENWKNPANVLKTAILATLESDAQRAIFQAVFGITEAVVMRSAVEPTEEILKIDPLAVSVHNYWKLPLDAQRFVGVRQAIRGVEYLDDFKGFLQQKVYTYNAGNATIAYLGALKGHKLLYEAANDPQIVEMLGEVYDEINCALCRELKITPEKQAKFAQSALQKYQDRHIMDFTERHGRDPLRKLGPEDRIVGVARMIQRQGIEPKYVARTLAAALYYTSDNDSDPTCRALMKMRREEGIDMVMEKICKIFPGEPLADFVHVRIDELKRLGWIHES